MTKSIPYILVFFLTLSACQNKKQDQSTESETQEIEQPAQELNLMDRDTSAMKNLEKVYKNDKIGWTISIPEGWLPVSDEQLGKYDEQAEALLAPPENHSKAQVKLEYMAAFQKDEYTLFSSMLEPYAEEFPGEYAASFKDIKNNLYTAYKVQKVNVDTSSGMDTIAGVEFYVYNTAIYDKNFMYIMNQVMYSAMYKGYDVSFNLTYRHKEDFAYMVELLHNSTFE
jgi:hypothetical protein